MTAIAYISNVYKLYKNNKLGICEKLDFTHPDMCNTEFFEVETQVTCDILLNPNFCNIQITIL